MGENSEHADRIIGLENQVQQLTQTMQTMMEMMQRGMPATPPNRPAEGRADHNNAGEQDEHVVPEPHEENPPLAEKVEEKFKAEEKRICLLEQQMRKFQNSSTYRPDEDFSKYQNIHVPEKFKVPDFDKYTGNSCPRTHVRVYLNKMVRYADQDQLLIRTFIESLAGSAIKWYINLKTSEYLSFSELANDFIRQYDFNSEMAPTLSSLEKMAKEKNESFKEYARRWREAATQILPLPGEQELITAFIKTLKSPFFTPLLSCNADTFSTLVKVGDRIDEAVRDGRIYDREQSNDRSRSNWGKEKAAEVNVAFQTQASKPFTLSTTQGNAGSSQRQATPRRAFTPLPKGMTYEDILPALLQEKLVDLETPRHTASTPSFRPDEKCAFHGGAPGHSTERCLRLKHLLQDLIEAKKVAFPPEAAPSVNHNPLPKHDQ